MSKLKTNFSTRITVARIPKEDKDSKSSRIIIAGRPKSKMINREEFQKTPEERIQLKEMKVSCTNKVLSSDENRR